MATKEAKTTFTRKAALALPSLSIKDIKQGDSLFVKIEGEITSKAQLNKKGEPDIDDNGEQKIIHHVMATDLTTGQQGEMVLPYIIKKAFDAVIASDGSIAGKMFELVKGRKVNRTNEWSVYEIE